MEAVMAPELVAPSPVPVKNAPRPANMLTVRQMDVLIYLWNFYTRNDQLPPVRCIAAHFGHSSCNGSQEQLDAIARKGWIEKNECGRWKFTQITRDAMALV